MGNDVLAAIRLVVLCDVSRCPFRMMVSPSPTLPISTSASPARYEWVLPKRAYDRSRRPQIGKIW
jgi:hypothetical protein